MLTQSLLTPNALSEPWKKKVLGEFHKTEMIFSDLFEDGGNKVRQKVT